MNKTWHLKLGLHCEDLVRKNLKALGCEILAERVKTPYAEIDFFFRSSQGQLVVLEVKSLSRWSWIETRITSKQKQRIKRAALFLENSWNETIQICAAFVVKNKITYLEMD